MLRLVPFLVVLVAVVAEATVSIDCHPDTGSTATRCRSRGCRWQPTKPGQPWCTFPSGESAAFAGYDADLHTGRLTRRNTQSLFGQDSANLQLSLDTLTETTFRITLRKTTTAPQKEHHDGIRRFLRSHRSQTRRSRQHSLRYSVQFQARPFGIGVTRNVAGSSAIFNTTNLPGLTFSRNFIQISTRVPTRNVYGFGEQWHRELRHDFNWRRYSLFTQDHLPQENTNLYGFHPFYMGLDVQYKAYGVYVHTTYPMDVMFQPDPDLITMRLIGGDSLQLYFFMGPTADDVISQYTALIGRPQLPPYWAMGFQLSRYGLKDMDMVEKVWRRNRAARIPQDTQVLDIDYMSKRLDFTYDRSRFGRLPNFVNTTIHGSGRKLVLILDPGIASRPLQHYSALDIGLKMNVFLQKSDGSKPAEGRVWPGFTYFPDFTSAKNVTKYWTKMLFDFHTIIPYDGIWIDMNDPSNFVDGSVTGCARNTINNPPFLPVNYRPLYKKTLCLDTKLENGDTHLQWHNYYGHHEMVVTNKALGHVFADKRPFILSRSTSPGSGAYGAHWTGDVESNWESMNQSIIGMLEFNMFGIPFVGADICGFNGNTNEELCLRWSQLGSFYPFCRNHNSDDNKIDQDPAAWPPPTRDAIRSALVIRYSLLPYLYTLFYEAHSTGRPVVRPLFYDHPTDIQTHNLHEQFLWGRDLMVAPILAPNTSEKRVYFPSGAWYDLNDMYSAVPSPDRNRWLTRSIRRDQIGLFVRGGSVLVWQQAGGESTTQTRQRPFSLTVALPANTSRVSSFSGSLFWDNGVTVDENRHCLVSFVVATSAGKGVLSISSLKNNCENMPRLQNIHIVGIVKRPKRFVINGRKHRVAKYGHGVAVIKRANILLNMEKTTVLNWK